MKSRYLALGASLLAVAKGAGDAAAATPVAGQVLDESDASAGAREQAPAEPVTRTVAELAFTGSHAPLIGCAAAASLLAGTGLRRVAVRPEARS